MNEEKKFVKIGQLKENGYVLIDDCVCQIREIEKSKPGKHGSAKARITAIDIFTGSKKTLLKQTGDDGEVPIILKGSAQIVAVMGETIQIMDMEKYETYTVPYPAELPGLQSGNEVEYHQYGNSIKIIRKKG